MQDAFTDMSISVRKMTVEEEPYCNMKTYVHMGMFATAVTIQNMLFENEVLQRAFEKHPVSFIRFCWNLKLNPGAYLYCHMEFTLHICSLPCSAGAMLLGWVFSTCSCISTYVLGQISLCLKCSLNHFMAWHLLFRCHRTINWLLLATPWGLGLLVF